MTVDKAGDEEQHESDHQDPREGEVPAPCRSEVVARGYRRPARERPPTERQPGMVEVRAILTPVEVGMGVEDHHTAHQHDEDGQRIDTVPESGGLPMSVGCSARL